LVYVVSKPNILQ